MHPHSFGRKAAALVRLVAPMVLIATAATPLLAQANNSCNDGSPKTARAEHTDAHAVTRTVYLTNVSSPNEANEVLVALRNMLDPTVRIYLVSSQNAIVMHASPDQIEAAQRIINDLTHPRKTYRVVFTVSTFDGSRKIGAEHVAVDALVGQHSVLKQGRKVPVAVTAGKPGEGEQFTYLDVGTNLDVTLTETGTHALVLKSKVEESSVGDEKPIDGAHPVVHQSLIEGVTEIAPGKAVDLGSVDIAGTGQRLSVEASLEPLS